MRGRLIRSSACLLWVLIFGQFLWLRAEEAADEGKVEQRNSEQEFDISKVRSKLLAGISGEPARRESIASVKMLISTQSEDAQEHFRIGANHFLNFWDLEAYRHFVKVVEADPDCLMGYWGICVSLAAPGPAFKAERVAAFMRMKELVEADKGNDLEREMCGALAALYAEGPDLAGQLFGMTAERHRAALMPGLLAAMMLRDGYDDFGEMRDGQRVATQILAEMEARHRDAPAYSFYRACLHETGPSAETGRKLAESLLQREPNYPPYRYLLGFFAFRVGDFVAAANEFATACDQFDAYYKAQEIERGLCVHPVQSLIYRATCEQLAGNQERAIELARQLTDVDWVNEGNAYQPAALVQLWQGRTLEARLAISRGDFKAALDALPDPRKNKVEAKFSNAVLLWDALREYADARLAADNGELERVRRFQTRIDDYISQFVDLRSEIYQRGAGGQWAKAIELLSRLSDELRGEIARLEGGDSVDSRKIWLQAAIEKIPPPELTSAPMLISVPEFELAAIEMEAGQEEQAAALINQGLVRFPRHPQLLELQNRRGGGD